jgi:hypothetical protein
MMQASVPAVRKGRTQVFVFWKPPTGEPATTPGGILPPDSVGCQTRSDTEANAHYRPAFSFQKEEENAAFTIFSIVSICGYVQERRTPAHRCLLASEGNLRAVFLLSMLASKLLDVIRRARFY